MKSDYIIKSYGGVLGELGLPLATKNNSVGQTLKQKVTVDPVFSNDIQKDFYDTKTKLDQAYNDLNKQGVRTENLNESLRKMFNKKSMDMGKIRKRIKEIQVDSSLSSDERLKQIRALQEQINQIAASGNQIAR
jgi:predicted  nucleic acid-binding Zn-ribbon protein